MIIRPDVLRIQRREVLGASLLGVFGIWRREGDVRHLVVHGLLDLSGLLGSLTTVSRDFCRSVVPGCSREESALLESKSGDQAGRLGGGRVVVSALATETG